MVDVGFELGLERLAERDRLAGDDVHERAALRTGEHRGVDLLEELLGVRQDEAAARAAQRLVAGRRRDVGVRHGAGMRARGNEAGDVGHVHHEVGAHLMRDLGHAREVNRAGIGGSAADDDLRANLLRLFKKRVVVDDLGHGIDAVGFRMVELAREVCRAAVGEVAAVVEAHTQNGVAGLDQREVRRQVRVRTGMGLDVRELRAVELAGAIAREIFHDVDLLATAVIALARIAFRVLVGEHATHGLHDSRTSEVLRSDELDTRALTSQLSAKNVGDLGIAFTYILQRHITRPFQSPKKVCAHSSTMSRRNCYKLVRGSLRWSREN